MQGITLLVALIASAIVFFNKPIWSLVVYCAVIAWYPSYLAVSIGTVDFTLQRIVILAIFGKLFLQTDLPNRFKFIWLDKFIIAYFGAEILAGVITSRPLMPFLENRGGAVCDMALPYFAVRMIVRDKQQYLVLLKAILVIAAPLAIIGFYQCLTGNNPVGFLRNYDAWTSNAHYVPIPRHGFFRASVTFPMSIMFGLFFAMFGPVCAGILRSVSKNKILYLVGLLLMGVGVFSSMSAGPWLAVIFAVCFIAAYRYRKYWKLILTSVILMCVIVEIISNRHFYEVIDRFTFSGQTAWYRSKLIDVALFEGGMSGHWLTGYGYYVDPGWGLRIDGLPTDGVNHYVLILARYGLIGLIPFFAFNIAAIKRILEAYRASTLDSDKWLAWCLLGSLFGLAGAFMSVSLFGQPTTIYYMMIGFAGVMPTIVSRPNSLREIKVTAGVTT